MVSGVSRGTALSHDLLEHILVKTDGVPLFVEEVTRAVLETGTPGLVALSIPQSGLAVPATLHASLMARLDQLGPIARDVAQKGSMIGREFSYELLEVIANLPKPQLQEALRLLINIGLLFTRGTHWSRYIRLSTHWCKMQPTARCCAVGGRTYMDS